MGRRGCACTGLTISDLRERWRLDVAFGLLLVSGVCVAAACLLSIGNWLFPQGEDAFAIYLLGMFSFVPTALAALGLGIQAFLVPDDRAARLGAALAAGHLVFWPVVIGLAMWLADSQPPWIIWIALLETSIYGTWTTRLAVDWFRSRR